MAREQDILPMNAVMQERERLSRELHDDVVPLVAHLLLRLDTIKELVKTDRLGKAGLWASSVSRSTPATAFYDARKRRTCIWLTRLSTPIQATTPAWGPAIDRTPALQAG